MNHFPQVKCTKLIVYRGLKVFALLPSDEVYSNEFSS